MAPTMQGEDFEAALMGKPAPARKNNAVAIS
jgi:hypothetical protein